MSRLKSGFLKLKIKKSKIITLVAHVMNETSPLLNNPAVNAFKKLQTKVFLGVHIGVYQPRYSVYKSNT